MTKNHVIVRFEPMGRLVEGRHMETIMDVCTRENLPVRSDCGGKGKCGKCLAVVDPAANVSEPTQAEIDLLPKEKIEENFRMVCQAQLQGPVAVTIPEQFADAVTANGKRLTSAAYPVNPLVRRVFMPKAPYPSHDDPVDDISQWFIGRLNDAVGDSVALPIIDILRRISSPEVLRKEVTAVVHQEFGITSILEGKTTRSLGLAVDIGTTSLAVYLCDMQTGRVVAWAAAANPQRRFGEDVISRITYANQDAGNTQKLQKLVVDAVSHLTVQCVSQVSAGLEDIDEVTIVGNTTMEQLFYGTNPWSLGVAPFLPLTRNPMRTKAGKVGLSLGSDTPVYIFPVIAGFVGGDTLGAVLADKPYLQEDTSLLVDIGTNGELVMGNRDKLWAASCATGPAFEGAQISCGMRAVTGAICKLDIDGNTGTVSYEVIGEGDDLRPLGLCGSGIIDSIAALRRSGIILESGSFQADSPGVVYDDQGIGRSFVLVPKEESGTGMPISITLPDIRQIQLAKAALAVGIIYLMRHVGKKPDRTILTGAFGARFDWRNALTIGMLPDFVAEGEVLPMDNLAGVGAIMALLDGNARKEIEDIYQSIHHVNLAKEPDFHNLLTKHMMFPALRENSMDDG